MLITQRRDIRGLGIEEDLWQAQQARSLDPPAVRVICLHQGHLCRNDFGIPLRHSCLALGDTIKLLEICPQGVGLSGELAKRVTLEGGAALVVDYGRDKPYADSLAAIKDHSFVPVLSQPGLADLSAHVDFSALRYVTASHCALVLAFDTSL